MKPLGPKLGELRQRVFFLLAALVIYRLGAHAPVPGIDPGALSKLFDTQGSGILGLFNLFSGGALGRFTVFALGIMPYISASIIMQLMSSVVPQLEQLRKEGEAGRRKINQYTRYATLGLAIFQASGIAVALESQQDLVLHPGWEFRAMTVLTLCAGSMFLMWLGEQITERGIGNGISMIIFAGIVAGIPGAVATMIDLARTGAFSPGFTLGILLLALVVTALVAFVERAQRRIPIHYAKRQMGRQMLAAPPSYLPLKINVAGVIPPIFASSIILFPATLSGWFSHQAGLSWLSTLARMLSPGTPLHMVLYAAAIVFFAFFYTAVIFNPKETADNLKKSGAFVPGIRPGEQTARYLDKVLSRLTLAGSVYVALVCLIPEFLIARFNLPFYFGGTSLLIVVVVTIEFMAQIQTYLMANQYESLLKKTSFRGGKMAKGLH